MVINMDPNQNQGSNMPGQGGQPPMVSDQGVPQSGMPQAPMGGGMPNPPAGGLNEVPGAPAPGAEQTPAPGTSDIPPSGGASDSGAPSDDSATGGSEGASSPQSSNQLPATSDQNKGVIAPKPKEGEAWDTIIIGSGPSGLTAAIYTTRAALSTLIIGGSKWGGQLMLTTEIDNFPGFSNGIQGPDLMMAMRKQAERFGAEFEQQDVESVDLMVSPFSVTASGKNYKGKSVIIATGAEARWLGLPNEQKLIGRGVSSCAPCDAPFFRGKNVIVVGGGDAAMEEALVLTKYATSVTLVHRRDAFRASKAMQSKVLGNPKVKVVWNSGITDILGEEKVIGVKIADVVSGKVQEMPIDGIFVAIGHTPSSKIFAGQLELDEKGYLKIVQNAKFKVQNEQGKEIGNAFSTLSSVEGVFIAGDVHDFHYRQAITAAGLGCMAAMDAERWLEMQKK